MAKKKRSCIDCMNLRHQGCRVWCQDDVLSVGWYEKDMPIFDNTEFRNLAKSCEAFDDADL